MVEATVSDDANHDMMVTDDIGRATKPSRPLPLISSIGTTDVSHSRNLFASSGQFTSAWR